MSRTFATLEGSFRVPRRPPFRKTSSETIETGKQPKNNETDRVTVEPKKRQYHPFPTEKSKATWTKLRAKQKENNTLTHGGGCASAY